jgi:hypothetical protein
LPRPPLVIDLGAFSQGAGQDPTQTLQCLKAACGTITRVGRQPVREEPTTHYKAAVDVEVPSASDTVDSGSLGAGSMPSGSAGDVGVVAG